MQIRSIDATPGQFDEGTTAMKCENEMENGNNLMEMAMGLVLRALMKGDRFELMILAMVKQEWMKMKMMVLWE